MLPPEPCTQHNSAGFAGLIFAGEKRSAEHRTDPQDIEKIRASRYPGGMDWFAARQTQRNTFFLIRRQTRKRLCVLSRIKKIWQRCGTVVAFRVNTVKKYKLMRIGLG